MNIYFYSHIPVAKYILIYSEVQAFILTEFRFKSLIKNYIYFNNNNSLYCYVYQSMHIQILTYYNTDLFNINKNFKISYIYVT